MKPFNGNTTKIASVHRIFARHTVELQWPEHRWLVYHGYFEPIFESLGKYRLAADLGLLRVIFCYLN